MIYTPTYGTVTRTRPAIEPEAAKDIGDTGWRVCHTPTNSVIPIKFGRESDAIRASQW